MNTYNFGSVKSISGINSTYNITLLPYKWFSKKHSGLDHDACLGKLPPKIFNLGGYLTVLAFPSSKINSTKEPPESKEDWKRNASFGFFGHKRISRHPNNNPN